jgi:hypothetical protein
MNLLANNTPPPPIRGDINRCHLGEKKIGKWEVRNVKEMEEKRKKMRKGEVKG